MGAIEANESGRFLSFDLGVLLTEHVNRAVSVTGIHYDRNEPKQSECREEKLRPANAKKSNQRNDTEEYQAKCDELEGQWNVRTFI